MKATGLCHVTAAPVNGSEIVPLYQKLYSARAADFSSENAELLEAIDAVRRYTEERGIWTIDREENAESCWSHCWSGNKAS